MSGYIFHCRKCMFAHAGECASGLWRWITNYTVPMKPDDAASHAKWVGRYLIAPRTACEIRYGKPFGISDYITSQVFEEKALGVPQTESDSQYPAGALYIPLEVWIEWQLSFKGEYAITREQAIKNAYDTHHPIVFS